MSLHKQLFTFCILYLAPLSVWAGGFYLPEIATPGSIGTAGAANPTNTFDSSSAITNPAGMVHLTDEKEWMVGGQLMIPYISFDSDIAAAGGSDGGNAGDAAMAPGMSFTFKIDDKQSVGFGLSALLGGGVDYGKDFVGRYQATKAILTGAGLTASYGYKLNEAVSLGIGLTMINTLFLQNISVPRPGSLGDGEIRLEDLDSWSPQAVLGLMWRANEKMLIGFVYRSRSEIELDGKMKTRNLAAPPFDALNGQEVTLEFDAPEVFEIGIQYNLTTDTKLLLEADIERFSQFESNYLTINSLGETVVLDRGWDDTWRVSAAILKRQNGNLFSMGIGYDSSPVNDRDRTFDLPVDEQLRLGIAWGKELDENTRFGVSAEYLWLGKNKIDQLTGPASIRVKGDYQAHMLMIGVNYNRRF